VTVRVVDQPNKVTVTEEVVTVQVASVGVQGPQGPQGPQGEPGLDGTGAPIFGQVAKMTSGTITIATQGTYQSTGLTATLDGENAGISLGTSDLFAIKNTSGVTRRLKIAASYDASMAGPAKVLGLALAVNGVVDLDTECRATTGLQGAIAKLATAWIIDLADGDEVALYVANHSSTVDIDFQRGRIVATSVAGFGPQGPTGATGPAGPGVATGGTTGDLLVKQSSTDFDTAWQAFGLDDLSDVDLTGVGDDDILQFDSALGVFLPVPVPSGGSTSDRGAGFYVATTESGQHCMPGWWAQTTTQQAAAENQGYFVPMYVSSSQTLTNPSVYVASAVTASFVRIALYNATISGAELNPTTLIQDFGTVATDSTGRKTATGTVTLAEGFYFVMWVSNSTPTIAGLGGIGDGPVAGVGLGAFPNPNRVVGRASVTASSAAPATAPTLVGLESQTRIAPFFVR
jgi:hypothetical protein